MTMTEREIPIEAGEVEAIEDAAREQNPPGPDDGGAGDASAGSEPGASFDRKGRVIRTVITTKDFLADQNPSALLLEVPRGEVVTLGLLSGEITSVEKKIHNYKGDDLTSYWLNGTFEAVLYATGEVYNAPQAILPRSYGVQVFNAFHDLGINTVILGCSIGLRHASRGGAITYEWNVRDHMPAAASSRVAAISKRLQDLLGPPAPPLSLGAGSRALPAPKKSAA